MTEARSLQAVYRPRTDDVLLIDEAGETFAIPSTQADAVAAAIRLASRTPALARQLAAAGTRSAA